MVDKMQNRTYSIEPYNPNWVLKFNEIKKMNYKETPDLFKKLIDAKDKRKAELNYASIIQPEEIVDETQSDLAGDRS